MIKNKSYKALIQAYTEYLQTLGYAATTVYDYPIFVKTFFTYLEQKGIFNINQLTTKTVFDYYRYLEQKRGERTKQTFSSSHLNRNFLAVDKLLEFLHQTGLETAPPPTKYLIEHHRKKPLQVLTTDEIQALYKAVPLTFFEPKMNFAIRETRQMTAKLMLDLCYGCGLRRSEALNLKIKDVDFDKKIIHVRQGKNYKDRFIPMSKKVAENIQIYVYQYRRSITKRPEYLYPFGSAALAEALQFLVEQSSNKILQTKNPTLHTLRHSIATHLLQNGMDIESIARFLGHSTLESTQLYTHILNENQHEF